MNPNRYVEDSDYPEEINLLKKSNRLRQQSKSEQPRKKNPQNLDQIAEVQGLESGFKTTYKAARHEEIWLAKSLHDFYDQNLITDVLAQVKGGKEASVYRCQAFPALGVAMVAAKVYRPRQFRNLSNDKLYREGRQLLTGEGRAVKRTDHRIRRALGKKTAYGEAVEHTSWLMYEFKTLELLYKQGAAVPKPFAVAENAILMAYYGDIHTAAPTLNEISLERETAEDLFQKVLFNLELMLQNNLIHGDLSAYNLLYWQGEIIMIDFPQVVNRQTNSNAEFILRRDVTRVCEYFARQGVSCDPAPIMNDFREKYLISPEG